MARRRRPSVRVLVGFAVLVIGIVEVLALVQTVQSESILRDRVIRSVREEVLAGRRRIARALLPGGKEAWQATADEILTSALASEVEVYDHSGVRLFAYPAVSPVEHWLERREMIGAGQMVTLGPFAGEATRVLTYGSFRSGDTPIVLRLSTAVPELVTGLRHARRLLIGHGVALAILLLAAGLALLPEITGADAPSGPLQAYEEAMERLRDHGQELSKKHDVERRQLETEIRETQAMARAGELTSGIVHEVRNGLSTILGYAGLLERGVPQTEAMDAAQRIRQECETLEGVVRRFMEFVREESLHVSSFDLGRLLARVVARESRSRPGPVVSVPSDDLGSLVGDEELLERAFENLVRNAREASGDGGRVSIGVARSGERVAVTVADDGPGLPPGMTGDPRPFFTTKADGLGLGLPLASKIVRLHGGELTFTNLSPRGCAVTVQLPASRTTSLTDPLPEVTGTGP